jgi:cysteine desulfurase
MIYLDHNATTPVHPEVKKVMIGLMDKAPNPSSVHKNGRAAKAIIENAREQIMNLAHANSTEYQLIYTSCGTEANNLIINNFKDADVFISGIEHLSIFGFKDYLSSIKVIKVDRNGILDLHDLEDNLKNSKCDKKLVSVMLANNEAGVIQPLDLIVEVAKKYGALVHSDLAQVLGKISVNITELELDFATISAHKFGGPMGAGALIAGLAHHIKPMIIGGGQERGARAGTENLLAIAGFGKAAEVAKEELESRHNKMRDLQEYLENNLPSGFSVVASAVPRLPNTSLLIAKNMSAQNLLIALDLKGIMVSTGSACSSGKIGKSHVLAAMNYDENEAQSAIRVSVSQYNTKDEIDEFIQACNEINIMRKTA